jgi:hypothetical protein
MKSQKRNKFNNEDSLTELNKLLNNVGIKPLSGNTSKINKVKNDKDNIVMLVDRLHIYRDFMLILVENLYEYYIDDGSFDNDDNRKFHKWCYDKTSDEFLKQGLNFKDNGLLEEYLYKYHNVYFFDELYREKNAQVAFWVDFFDMSKVNSKTSISNLVNIYVMFSISVDKDFKDIFDEQKIIL